MESPNTQQGENATFEDPHRPYNGEYLASSPVSLYGCIPLTLLNGVAIQIFYFV